MKAQINIVVGDLYVPTAKGTRQRNTLARFLAASVLGLFLLMAYSARATSFAEDFAYGNLPLYGNLSSFNGGSGWGTNTWQTASGRCVSQTNQISYNSDGYAITQAANSGTFYGNYPVYRGAYRMVGAKLTNVVWFSALMKVSAGQQAYVGFNTTGTNDVSSPYPSTTYSIGISNSTFIVGYGGNTSGGWSGSFTAITNLAMDATHLVLGCISFNFSGTNTLLQVWADPADLSNLGPAYFQQSSRTIGSNLFNACVGSAATSDGATGGLVSALRFSDGNGSPSQAFADVSGRPNPARFVPVLVGAIRWDAAEDTGSVGAGFQAVLSPNHWHYRVPFFSQVIDSDSVVINGNSQSIMDQEINYAANAGLNYWAFDLYPETSGLSDALHLYLSSPYKSRINFACVVGGTGISPLSGLGYWTNTQARFVSYFKDPSYQTVLGNRPLFFVLTPMPTNVATTVACIAQLRSACTNAGLGNPYIVYQNSEQNATNGYNVMLTYAMDAMGSYGAGAGYGGTGTGEAFSDLSTRAQNLWAAQAATTAEVVPIVTSGYDNRPFVETYESWYGSGSTNYYLPPTPEELAGELNAALNWTAANQNGATPANTILFYAWNEHAEGGWICPTLNTNDWVTPDTSRLDAIAATLTLFSFYSRVTNYSFELPIRPSANWYPGTLPSSFGWSNNLGSNVLYSVGLHFGTAADGNQALTLSNGYFISQDTGPTVGDTAYQLGFSLLQGKESPNTNASVQVQLFDGLNLLAAGTFFVPTVSNVWKQCTLSATSPHVPAGDLIIKFIGGTNGGATWIDRISLAETSLRTPPFFNSQPQSQTNGNGRPMVFTVSAIGGAAALTYRWQMLLSDGTFHNLTDGNAFSGSTTATLCVGNVTSPAILSYRVVITNIYGSVTSSVATLLWNPIQMVGLTNASFELPAIGSNGWYMGNLPANFGWSNNLGQFVLSTSSTNFSAAADGLQSLFLPSGGYIFQMAGRTATNTFYTLSFSLLQSQAFLNPNASVRAGIFDGTNVLASSTFTVPAVSNLWQTFTLTALSPLNPAGNLSIRFDGETNGGMPWIDAVSLSSFIALATTVSLTNASFEIPAISPNGWYSGSSLPSSFGWSNNLGSFALSTYGSQFSAAADGRQALYLANGKYISRPIGSTAPDTWYSLNFSLLQSPYVPNTNATVRAEILDGPNLLASTTFVVPMAADVWEQRILNAVSPHAPAGNLIIRFTGGATGGEPVIDNVWLSSDKVPPAAGVTLQQAPGGQLILNWDWGMLLEATNVAGPWTPNFNVPPYTISPTNGVKFYRIRLE